MSDTYPEHTVVEQWSNHAASEIDTRELRNKRALLFELQQALNQLSTRESISHAHTNADTTVDVQQEQTTDELIDTIGALLLQFQAVHNGRNGISDGLLATANPESGDTTDSTKQYTEGPDEQAVRKRIQQLIEQGVSSVSRITGIIQKEFDGTERGEISQIAAEERANAGEMDTLGNPSDYVDHRGE